MPPLPSAQSKTRNATFNSPNLDLVDDYSQSFPQVEADEIREIEPEFQPTTIDDLAEVNRQYPLDKTNINEEEPELFYSFEEELPQNYEELLEASIPETSQSSRNPLPTPNDPRPHNRNNRFLNKLQTLSAEAIAAQKASQRTEELLLDTFAPSDPLLASEAAGDSTNISIDLDNPEQAPRTIAEATSLAELDLELDVELDRLLTSEPDFILNEYVWEESIDPNSFPISAVSPPNSTASTLSETARTIRNIQETTPQALSDQEPIPIPEIIIPAGEMLSGTPMQIAVRLPAITPKFFVKFWIKDLQTRMIVDGPRWLLDFSKVPNAEFIETRTNISIPLSSIDVAFEAIAIEAQTQRESHKVRVTRAVTPPNLAQDFEDT